MKESQLLRDRDCELSNHTRHLLPSALVKESHQICVVNHTKTLFSGNHLGEYFFLCFDPLAVWLAGCRGCSPSCDTEQLSWLVKPGSAPSYRQQREAKRDGMGGCGIDPCIFHKQNVPWQQNAPSVIKAALFREVIRDCLSLRCCSMCHCLDKWHQVKTWVVLFYSCLSFWLVNAVQYQSTEVKKYKDSASLVLLICNTSLQTSAIVVQVRTSSVRQSQEADLTLRSLWWVWRSCGRRWW